MELGLVSDGFLIFKACDFRVVRWWKTVWESSFVDKWYDKWFWGVKAMKTTVWWEIWGDRSWWGVDGEKKNFAVGVWKDLLPGFAAKRTNILVLNTPSQYDNNSAHNENGGICAKHRRIFWNTNRLIDKMIFRILAHNSIDMIIFMNRLKFYGIYRIKYTIKNDMKKYRKNYKILLTITQRCDIIINVKRKHNNTKSY